MLCAHDQGNTQWLTLGMMNRLKLIELDRSGSDFKLSLGDSHHLFEPEELSVGVLIGQPQQARARPQRVAFDQELGQLKIEVHFFVFVVSFKGSGGEDFAAGFALVFSDFLIESADGEEAFFDIDSP